MSVETLTVEQELQRRQIKEEAATRDTANVRRIGKGFMIACWFAPIVPLIGFFGLFFAFWAGTITGGYLLFAGARKSGIRMIVAAFLGTFAAGLIWALIYFVVLAGGNKIL